MKETLKPLFLNRDTLILSMLLISACDKVKFQEIGQFANACVHTHIMTKIYEKGNRRQAYPYTYPGLYGPGKVQPHKNYLYQLVVPDHFLQSHPRGYYWVYVMEKCMSCDNGWKTVDSAKLNTSSVYIKFPQLDAAKSWGVLYYYFSEESMLINYNETMTITVS